VVAELHLKTHPRGVMFRNCSVQRHPQLIARPSRTQFAKRLSARIGTGVGSAIAVLFHTMVNLPWGLIPNFESYFNPIVLFIIVALVSALLVFVWGPSTLARSLECPRKGRAESP